MTLTDFFYKEMFDEQFNLIFFKEYFFTQLFTKASVA